MATSAKTLYTASEAKIVKPATIYSSIKKNIDAAADFVYADIGGVEINEAGISMRQVQIAIPSNTNAAQWAQINRAINYAESQGVSLKITVVK